MELFDQLFKQATGQMVSGATLLPQSGSNRKYYRITGENGFSLIGVYSTNRTESNAFLSFSKALHSANLKVPQIYAEDLDNNIYLQEDLGDLSLYHTQSKPLIAAKYPWGMEQTLTLRPIKLTTKYKEYEERA